MSHRLVSVACACLLFVVAFACVRCAKGTGEESSLKVPAPAPRISNGAWISAMREHPRLLGPRAYLQAMARAKPQIYAEIRANNALLASGVTHAVEGISRERIDGFIAAAMKNVQRGLTNVHQDTWIWLTDVALTYDLFFNEIQPQDRLRMIEWMNGHLTQYTTDEGAFHNSTLSKILCYLRIAYATWGENPQAKAFRDDALVKLYEGKVLPILLEFGAGGGYTECGW